MLSVADVTPVDVAGLKMYALTGSEILWRVSDDLELNGIARGLNA
jgi:hypothetical protein